MPVLAKTTTCRVGIAVSKIFSALEQTTGIRFELGDFFAEVRKSGLMKDSAQRILLDDCRDAQGIYIGIRTAEVDLLTHGGPRLFSSCHALFNLYLSDLRSGKALITRENLNASKISDDEVLQAGLCDDVGQTSGRTWVSVTLYLAPAFGTAGLPASRPVELKVSLFVDLATGDVTVES